LAIFSAVRPALATCGGTAEFDHALRLKTVQSLAVVNLCAAVALAIAAVPPPRERLSSETYRGEILPPCQGPRPSPPLLIEEPSG
jgi:hypothetical protein